MKYYIVATSATILDNIFSWKWPFERPPMPIHSYYPLYDKKKNEVVEKTQPKTDHSHIFLLIYIEWLHRNLLIALAQVPLHSIPVEVIRV